MKNFRLNLTVRILFLTFFIILFFYIYFNEQLFATLFIIGALICYQVYSLIRYIDITNKDLTRFLQSIKYSDFSQTFSKKKLGSSFEELNNSFNDVMYEFQKTRSEKEENFRFVQTVMQHVGVGLLTFNQEGKVEFINNAAKKLFKVNYLYNLNNLENIEPGLSRRLMNIRPGTKETIKLQGDNDIQQLVVYGAEFKLRDQKFTLLSLQNIQPELEEREMDAWQKLIRVLTHEIMNSVTPISSLAGTVNEIMSNGNLNDDETREDIKIAAKTIQKRSEGLIHFVDDYRSLTSIPKPNFEIMNIKDLFDRITVLLEKKLKENQIDFFASVKPESLDLTGDPDLIEQVLINLLLNSIHFVSDIKNPKIRLEAELDEWSKITIRVVDNGPGISEDIQEKIFIPFFSTKKNGSGIGLSLSRQIMRFHGGSIRVTSKPYNETAFILKF